MKKLIVKLIIFNLILLLLIHYLPDKENIIENIEENEVEETDIMVHEFNTTDDIQITNRSLAEPRQTYIAPTQYSQELVEFVKSKESLKLEAYILKGEKYYTIGYGHHGSDVRAGQVITEETAERLLKADLDGACEYVLKHCDYLQLTQGQLDALTSFTYNGGPGILNKLTANKTRNIEEIKQHITAYTNNGMKGLVIRRNQELEFFNR